MAKLIAYKSLLGEEKLFESPVQNQQLSAVLHGCVPLYGKRCAVWVNNVPVDPGQWHAVRLNQFDVVEVVRDIEGPAAAIGAVIGAVVGGLSVTGFLAGGVWAAAGWAALKGALYGYTIGSMVDSYINPPTMPNIGGLTADMSSDDPVYGWDGARTVLSPDGPIPVAYGEDMVGGVLIMQYISTDGENNYLHMLIALCEGEIEGIVKSDESGVCSSTSDTPYILINGQNYSSYEDVEWDYRLGTTSQSVIDGFHDTSTYYSDGRKVSKGSQVTYSTTGTDIESFTVQLTVPALYTVTDSGDIAELSVEYKLEYRVVGAGAWTTEGTHTITGKSKTTVYEYRTVENLTAGEYEIRVTRVTDEYTSFKKSGDLYLSGVTETTYDNIAYRGTALLALTIRATDQLSGGTPNVQTLIRGRKVEVPYLTIGGVEQTYDDCYWDDTAGVYKRTSDDATCSDEAAFVTQWSRHPIWCARDFEKNERFGLGRYSGSFDDSNARTEAKYCWELVDDLGASAAGYKRALTGLHAGEEHRFELDLVLSTYMSADDARSLFAKNMRAWGFWINNKYRYVIDRPRDPIMLFNMENMDPNSIKTTYFKHSETTNVVHMQYTDPERDWTTQTVNVVAEDEWTQGRPPREQTVNANGTSRVSQAMRDGMFVLKASTYVTKGMEFTAPTHAAKCIPGQVVRIQNDLMAWGVGGRVVAATSSSITVDTDVTYTAGYKVRVRLSDGTLEEKTVSSVTGSNRVINISGTFSSTPWVGAVFTYGADSADSKPFKVISIKRTGDGDCQVAVVEESANKYIDTSGMTLPDTEYSQLPLPTALPGPVTDLTLTEMASQPGFYVSFNIPQEDLAFSYADVLISMDNSYFWVYRGGISSNSDIEVTGTKPGITYYIKVVSYNAKGMANLSPATASITMTDANFRPPDVTGLQLDGEGPLARQFAKKDAKFKWNKSSLTSGAGHELAGQEALGAGQWLDDVYYKFIVEIHVGGYMIRRETVADPAYTYTYEKNLSDNNGSAVNQFTIKVWGYNEAANLKSLNYAALEVTNPAPAAVSGLTATAFMRSINFTWTPSTETDLSHYLYRIQVESDGWSDWTQTTDNRVFRNLTTDEQTTHGTDVNVRFEIKVVDTFGNSSSTESIDEDTVSLNIEPTDLTDFATISAAFPKIPILTGDTWVDDSPSSGYVAWSAHTLYYNGTAYSISANNTNLAYIYWLNGEDGYTSSDDVPTLGDGDFLIATNNSGAHDLAWNAMANLAVGSAFIASAAINDAHISDLSADKITAGTLSGIQIIGNTIKTVASGKGIIITSDGITLHVTDATGKYSTFKYGDGSKYGTGALAYIHHDAHSVPFYIAAEQSVADFHYYNRSSDPTGAAEVGDTVCVNGVLRRCISAGTPGTFRSTASL